MLVPVKFVPATVLSLGLNLPKEKEVGELSEQVQEGNLREVLQESSEDEAEAEVEIEVEMTEEEEDVEFSREVERELLGDLARAPAGVAEADVSVTLEAALEQATLDDAPTEVEVEVVTFEDFIKSVPAEASTPVLTDEPMPAQPAEGDEPLFFIDSTPSAVILDTPARPTRSGQTLGLSSTPAPEFIAKPRVVSITDAVAYTAPLPAAAMTPPPASALPPRIRSSSPAPAVKLSKGSKRALKSAGKKARRDGSTHARSGNLHQHRGFNQYSSDEEDAQAGAALFDAMGAGEVEDLDDELMDGVPRQGDSDLDWGDAVPVMRGGIGSAQAPGQMLSTGRQRRAQRKEDRQAQKEADKLERLAANARRQVAAEVGDAGARDYEANVLGEDEEVSSSSRQRFYPHLTPPELQLDDEEFAALQKSFVTGLLGPTSGATKTLAELAMDARAQMEEDLGWRTTDGESESDSDEYINRGDPEDSDSDELDSGDMEEMDHSLAVADAEVDAILAAEEEAMLQSDGDFDSSIDSGAEDLAVQQALLAGGKIRLQSMGVGGPGGRRDAKLRKESKEQARTKAKGKGKAHYASSSSSDDDGEDIELDSDDDMFNGTSTWAQGTDDYVAQMHEYLDDNKDLLMAQDRKSRRKMFKAIENG